MYDSHYGVFGFNTARSAALSLIAGLAVVMPLLAWTPARAEIIAAGDFSPAYADPPTASDLPLYGNDPEGEDSPAQMDVPVIIGVTGVGEMRIDTPSFTFPLVSLGEPDPSIIGQFSTALGEVVVTGFGSEWKILGELIVADEGMGFLDLTGGARVAAEEFDPETPVLLDPTSIVVGNQLGSVGFVDIDGLGSRLDSANLTIANEGNAVMTVTNFGSVLTRGEAVIGLEKDAVAKVTFNGLGTRWLVQGDTPLTGPPLDGNLTIGSIDVDGIGHSALLIEDEALVQVHGVATVNPRGRIELGGESGGGTLRTIETETVADSGFVTNHGVIMGWGWIEGSLVNDVDGELRNSADIANLRQHLLITGTVENDGLIDSFGGEMEFLAEVTNNGDIVARDALMRFRGGENNNPDLINNSQIVLGGDTTLYGDIDSSSGSIHTLSGSEAAIVGDLTFSSSSVVSLAVGPSQGTLDVVGTAYLNDSLLQLDYSAGVFSQPGDSYQVFFATDGLSGTFSNTTAIADGRIWDILAGPNTVIVTATGPTGPPVGSDFNGDGIVDRQDLLIWEANFPTLTGATGGEGDADGDGDVDGNDFLEWQIHNGGAPAVPAMAMVPEPATWLLLVLGGMLLTGAAVRPRRLCYARARG